MPRPVARLALLLANALACGTPAPAATATDAAAGADASPAADTAPASDTGAKPADAATPVDTAAAATPTEYVATLADFDCIKHGTKVGHFYVANRIGLQASAVAVAKSNAKGNAYPVGTILRIFPLEAMVKRGKEFAATGGWEFFKLKQSGGQLTIEQRGGAEVKNGSGPCLGCHQPAAEFDFVCGTDHGCAALGVTDEIVDALQDNDPLCKK